MKEDDLTGERLFETIRLVNKLPGPKVEFDLARGCYGLKARKCYAVNDRITEYGGVKTVKALNGDYVAKSGEVFIDGRVGFKLSQKGRWINESDSERSTVNVSLGRVIRATRFISAGEWLFADYGPEYARTY